MNRKKKLLLNTSASLIYQLTTVICSFILPRFFLSAYGSEVNGLINSITQFLSVFSLGEMGIGAVVLAAFYAPLAAQDTMQVSRIVKSANKFFHTISIILLIYIGVLVVAIPLGVRESFSYLYTAILVVAIAISSFAQYYFGKVNSLLLEADQRSYVPLTLNTVTTILNTAACVLLMLLGASVQIVKLVTSCIFLLQPIGMHIYVRHHYTIKRDVILEGEPIPQKWNGIAQHVSSVVLTNTDVIVLTLFSTLSNVSIYSVYYMVASGIRMVITSLSTGIQALFGNMLANGEMNTLQKTFSGYEWLTHTIVTLLFTVTSILIVPFISVYTKGITDANYIEPLFGALLCAAIGMRCIRLPYNIIALAAGHFKQTQTSCIIEAAINVVISVILVWNFGLVGVAIGTLAAMTYRTIYLAWYLSKNILNRNLRFFIKHMLVDVICVTLMIPATAWISMSAVSYFAWVIMAVKITLICAAISFITNLIFNQNNMKSAFSMLRRKAS